MTGVVTFGETMAVLNADTVGSLADIDRMTLSIGGAESNVAIGVARLGGNATWIGRIGADTLGRRIVRTLRAEGVNCHATLDQEAPTGLLLKDHPLTGHTRVLYHRAGSAGSRLDPSNLSESLIADAQVLHITGITPTLSDSAATAVDYAVDRASHHGVPVSFDVNHRSALCTPDRARPVYRRLAGSAAVLFVGLDEATVILGRTLDAPDALAALTDFCEGDVILKLGSGGCLARISGSEYRVPAIPIQVADTVGAGDAFVAGYLADWMLGVDPAGRLATAVAAGAMACRHRGDWEGAATRDELELLSSADPVTR